MIPLARIITFSTNSLSYLGIAALSVSVRKVSTIGDDLSASRALKPLSDPILENQRLRRQAS